MFKGLEGSSFPSIMKVSQAGTPSQSSVTLEDLVIQAYQSTPWGAIIKPSEPDRVQCDGHILGQEHGF